MSRFGRKPSADTAVDEAPRPEKPGGKNAPTPRRTQARAARARQLKGTPVTRAQKRARTNEIYNETRRAMKQTDPSKLPANERVPELIYVRDLVDTRANLATALTPVAVIYFFGTFVLRNAPVLFQGLLFLSLLWAVAMVVDTIIMTRKLDAKVKARFPGSTVPVRVYGGRRAFLIKRFRRPVARTVPDANRWSAGRRS